MMPSTVVLVKEWKLGNFLPKGNFTAIKAEGLLLFGY
jgi:hypothetical protein